MRRALPLRDHPFWEEAQVIRHLLREDRQVARSGGGRIVIAGNPDIELPRLRAEAQYLERLARYEGRDNEFVDVHIDNDTICDHGVLQ